MLFLIKNFFILGWGHADVDFRLEIDDALFRVIF